MVGLHCPWVGGKALGTTDVDITLVANSEIGLLSL